MEWVDAAVSVLVVDDHRMFADALAQRLHGQSAIGEVHVAGSLEEGRALLARHHPDVVLLDLALGAAWGPQLLQEGDATGSRVVALSADQNPAAIAAALAAGVDGYVEKGASFDTLLHAVELALAGEMYLSPHLVGPVVRHLLCRPEGESGDPSFLDQLTPRELEVLRCLAAGSTRADIARELHISMATVRTHVQHLLQRAQVHSTLALLAAARSAGLTTQGEAS